MTQEEKINKTAVDYARERLSNDDYPTYNDEYELMLAFESGSEYMQEEFEKERLQHCDELSPEQAEIESAFVVEHLKKNNRTPTFIDAIEYGWRKAVDKACEWLYQRQAIDLEVGNIDKFIEEFKKAMEE